MRISIDEIKDYMQCPIRYKFVHVDRLPAPFDSEKYYKECLKLTIFFYYFCMIEKKDISFDVVLRKWESLWFNKNMTSNFTDDYLRSKSNEAVTHLTDFYKKIYGEKIIPIAVNFPYEAVLPGGENLHVVGSIDLIRVVNDKTAQRETQIVSFHVSKHLPDEFTIKNEISSTVASYVFRKTFKTKEDRIKIISVAHKSDSVTTRTPGDFNRCEAIIRNVCAGIRGKVFYPVPARNVCPRCSYRLFCINERALS